MISLKVFSVFFACPKMNSLVNSLGKQEQKIKHSIWIWLDLIALRTFCYLSDMFYYPVTGYNFGQCPWAYCFPYMSARRSPEAVIKQKLSSSTQSGPSLTHIIISLLSELCLQQWKLEWKQWKDQCRHPTKPFNSVSVTPSGTITSSCIIDTLGSGAHSAVWGSVGSKNIKWETLLFLSFP